MIHRNMSALAIAFAVGTTGCDKTPPLTTDTPVSFRETTESQRAVFFVSYDVHTGGPGQPAFDGRNRILQADGRKVFLDLDSYRLIHACARGLGFGGGRPRVLVSARIHLTEMTGPIDSTPMPTTSRYYVLAVDDLLDLAVDAEPPAKSIARPTP